MSPRTLVTLLQALTFVVLAALLLRDGDSRLALAQILLAVITVVVYL